MSEGKQLGRLRALFITDHFREGTEALRDCPFCGARPQFTDQAVFTKLIFGWSDWGVFCPECHASTFAIHDSKQDAASHWNGNPPTNRRGGER